MQLNKSGSARYFLVAALLTLMLAVRVILGSFFLKDTVAAIFISFLALNWLVVPVLLKIDIEIPDMGRNLVSEKDSFWRAMFFFIGFTIFIMSMVR